MVMWPRQVWFQGILMLSKEIYTHFPLAALTVPMVHHEMSMLKLTVWLLNNPSLDSQTK